MSSLYEYRGDMSKTEAKPVSQEYDVFLICTVRNVTDEQKQRQEDYVSKLESEGKRVYYPHRDTNQKALGLHICAQNLEAIKHSKEVHIFYNEDSQGTHFDMGMAFALGKHVVLVEPGKSYFRMILEWSHGLAQTPDTLD